MAVILPSVAAAAPATGLPKIVAQPADLNTAAAMLLDNRFFCCADTGYGVAQEGYFTQPEESFTQAFMRTPDLVVAWQWDTHATVLVSSAWITFDYGVGAGSYVTPSTRIYHVYGNAGLLAAQSTASVASPSPTPDYTDPDVDPSVFQHALAFHRDAVEPWFYHSLIWGTTDTSFQVTDWVTTGTLPYIMDGESGVLPVPSHMGLLYNYRDDIIPIDSLCETSRMTLECTSNPGEVQPWTPANILEVYPYVPG